MKLGKKPTHGKATRGIRTQTNKPRGKARRRRSAQHKSTRYKANHKSSPSKYSKGKERDDKSDQKKITERQEGIWYILWQTLLSGLSLICNFCGFNFVWHSIQYFRPHASAATVSSKKEHLMVNERRKQVPHQLAVGGLCVNIFSLLLVLLVLVQVLLMLCGDVEPNPGPTTLTINELDQVLKTLQFIQHKWLELGRALLVPEQTLEILFRYCSPENCLREMLQVWMQSKDSILNWETVRDAVAAIGETDLSQFINHQYVSSFSQQQGIVLSVSVSSSFLCSLLSLMPLTSPYCFVPHLPPSSRPH